MRPGFPGRLTRLVAIAAAVGAALFVVGVVPAEAGTGTIGNTAVGAATDSDNANYISLSRFTMGPVTGAVTSMSVFVGQVQATPSNRFQVGIYTDSNNRPGTRVANSGTGTLTANSWNTIPITATLNANTAYWLGYNTNSTTSTRNNMKYNGGGTSTFSASHVPFGTWPATFVSDSPNGGANFSIFATYTFEDQPVAPLPPSGPGGPVLVIGSATNLYTTYYPEILKAEGLNHYRLVDISTVSASTLANYDVAILGEVPVTAAQVSMLTTWVNGGGKLIAMRPDKKLAPLLGLTDQASTLADAYLRIDNSSGPGVGIVGTTIQYHGTADRYALNGATAVATLYSNATTSTTNPAVTMRTVGSLGGRAAAFTYDLARSGIQTRQGNVNWAGQQRDGVDGFQASEMFFGAASGDPDWNNLANAHIPIADEQQRLLANMIIQTNLATRPLPRFWYFPRAVKAVIVMTGDDHATGGTAGRFNQYVGLSPAGCNVANWECVRSSSYIYTDTALSNAQAVSFHNQGFEIGLHPDTGCGPWGNPANLNQLYATQLAQFAAKYTGIPDPSSSRTHCVEWDDWATQAKTKLAHGIRLDTDYYYYPAAWVNNRPGYFNGTAQMMRFGDLDGSVIDVYNATTQMTDESGQTYPSTVEALLNGAYGPNGYYAALTANMHTDNAASDGSDAVIASAQSRGVPVVSGRQMLTWLDARNNSSYQSIAWNGTTLSFTVTGGANGLRGMLPNITSAGNLASISSGGNAVPFTTETIKGITYAFFAAAPGSYVATYAAGDTVPPTVVSTAPTAGATDVSTTSAVTVSFSEPMDPATLTSTTLQIRNPSNNIVPSSVTYQPATASAIITPTSALATSTAYTVTVTGGSSGVKDIAGNALAANHQFTFTTTANPAPPTILGYNQIGAQLDAGDMNHMNGSRFVTGPTSQTFTTISAYLKTVQAAPNNQYQLAIYTDNNGLPGTLVATSAVGTLTANSWNSQPISATLAANTAYWLMYNTNGDNNLSFDNGAAGQGGYGPSSQTFGTWPTNFGPTVTHNGKFSIYASSGVDAVPPTVVSTAPTAGATDVSTTSAVTVSFSEPMDPATLTSTTLQIRNPSNNIVPSSVTYQPATASAIITPTSALATSTAYTVTVTGGSSGVKDIAGNALAANHQFTFTTTANPAPPTILGYNQIGAQLDAGDMNHMNGSRFVTGPTSQTFTTISAYLKTVQAAPNNQYQLAIYTDNNGLPGTLVATSAVGTLTANSWNSQPISATLAANTAYWLMYNTNGDNNLSFDNGAAGQGGYGPSSQTFGTWPTNFGPTVTHNGKFSIYAT